MSDDNLRGVALDNDMLQNDAHQAVNCGVCKTKHAPGSCPFYGDVDEDVKRRTR